MHTDYKITISKLLTHNHKALFQPYHFHLKILTSNFTNNPLLNLLPTKITNKFSYLPNIPLSNFIKTNINFKIQLDTHQITKIYLPPNSPTIFYRISVFTSKWSSNIPSNSQKIQLFTTKSKNTNKSLLPHRRGYFQLKIKPHTGGVS